MHVKSRILGFSLILGVAATLSIGMTMGGAHDDDHGLEGVYVVQQGSDHANKAWLGVSVEEETDSPEGGARIQWVIDDSPAARLGLQVGDIVVSVDGKRVYGPGGLTNAIGSHDPGETVEIEIVRDGQNQALSVELGERSNSWSFRVKGHGDHNFHFQMAEEEFAEQMEQMRMSLEGLEELEGLEHLEELEHLQHLDRTHVAPRVWTNLRTFGQRPKLGVQLTGVTPELREHLGGHRDAGVLVGKVLKGLPAEMAGVEVGDLIESVNGATIEDSGDLIHSLRESAGQTIQLGVVRDGRPMSIDVFIPDPVDEDESSGPRA